MASYFLHLKVGGNFHISPGRSIRNSHNHVHDTAIFDSPEGYNLTHTINNLSFGPQFPGRVDALDNVYKQTDAKQSLFQYFVKIVPTSYITNSQYISSYQYSVTTHFKPLSHGHDSESLPGVFFLYELSPIEVVFRESFPSWASYLTQVFGTAGGLFTISTLLDWFLYKRALARTGA